MEPGDPDDENSQRRDYDPPPPERPTSLLSRCLWGLVWTVALSLTGVVVFRLVWHDGLWLFWVANALTPYLFVPAYVLLVLGTLSRRWGLNFLALALVCFHVASVGPQVLPRTPHPFGEAELKLVLASLEEANTEDEALLRELEVHTPDLLFLHGVTPRSLSAIETAGWTETYPHAAQHFIDQEEGTALLSKAPLRRVRRLTFGGHPQVSAMVALGEEDVEVLNVHLPPASFGSIAAHRTAADALVAWVRSREGPFIVAGNLQSTPYSALSATLEPHIDDGWNLTVGGLGGTWPNSELGVCPLRIDRVLFSTDLTSPEMILGEGYGSSHKLLMARIAFRE